MKTRGLLLPAALGAFAVVLFVPFFFQDRVLWSQDIGRVYFPVATALARALRAADPSGLIWCPELGAGHPLAADGVTTPFYPLHWLLLAWLHPARALSAALFLGYLGSGLAMAAFARTLGRTRAAAAVAGLVYGWCGFAVGHSVHVNVVAGLPFLPLVLLFLERAARGAALRNTALAGGCLGVQCLAGHPQVAAMTALLGASYALFRLWPHPLSARGLRGPAGLIVLFLTLGAGIAAPYYLPMAELAGQSVRPASLDSRQAAAFALPWPHLFTALSPFLFFDAATGRYQGAWNAAEMTFYAGLPSLVLAVLALRGRLRDPLILFFGVVGVVGLALALGDATPLYGLLHALPGFAALRGPARYALLFDVAVSVLAARGLDGLRTPERAPLSRREFLLLAATAALALTLPVAEPFWRDRWANDDWQDALGNALPPLLRAIQPWLPVVWLGLTALWLARRPRAPGVPWAATGVALVATDLAMFAAASFTPHWVPWADAVRPDAAQTLAATERQGRAYVVNGPEPWRSASDLPLALGFRSLNAYVSLPLARHALFMRSFWMSDQTSRALLDAAAVTTVVDSWRRPLAPPVELDGASFSPRSPLAVLRPSQAVTYDLAGARADRLRLVTSLAEAATMPQGTEVARLTIVDTSGGASTFSLRAGFETAERAYGPGVAHDQPAARTKAWSAFDRDSEGWFYLARFDWPGARPVETIRIESTSSRGLLLLFGAVFLDGEGRTTVTPFMGEGFGRRVESEGAVLYGNNRARPRAAGAHRVVLAHSPEDAVRRVAASQAPLTEAVVLEDEAAPRVRGIGPSSVTIVVDAPMHVELRADMKGDGYVVLADTFYPGWHATVDDAPAPIYAANGLFRAVFVKDGAHRVSFDYRPRALYAGLAVSAIAAISWLTCVRFPRRRQG